MPTSPRAFTMIYRADEGVRPYKSVIISRGDFRSP